PQQLDLGSSFFHPAGLHQAAPLGGLSIGAIIGLTVAARQQRLSQQPGEQQQLGTLTFSVLYDKVKQTLLVTVIRCDDLPSRDPQAPGAADPYVKLQLLPEKRHKVKTRVLRRTCSPVYEETFSFYGVKPGQMRATSLHFVVLSFDRFSRDEIIGEVLFPLGDMDPQDDPFSITREIQPPAVQGERLQLSLILQSRNQNRGELLVSLCYQPAASRLTAVVLKARNLPKMDVTGLAGDPYVKLYLLYNGQRIAKKKTHVKKRTLNPVYNESFVFEVPPNEGLHQLSLELLVLDWDRVTKNEVIGRLELGLAKGDLPDKHWQEVMNCPRKQIAEWHRLLE
uniref:Synaptotagmin-11 n=1 Tax=Macrostomum lignano TaxID=282301 RepID=A0A1I8JPA4_9PLAT